LPAIIDQALAALPVSILRILFRVPNTELFADAEAEVNQGGEADEEADVGVEALDAEGGEKA